MANDMHDEGYYTKYPRQWWSLVQWTQFGVFTLNTEYITWLALLPNYADCRWISELPTQKKKNRKNNQRPKGIPSCVCKNFVTVALEYLHDRCQPVIKQLKSVYKKQATTTATTTRTKGNEVAKKIYLCKSSKVFVFGHLKLPRNVWHVCVS